MPQDAHGAAPRGEQHSAPRATERKHEGRCCAARAARPGGFYVTTGCPSATCRGEPCPGRGLTATGQHGGWGARAARGRGSCDEVHLHDASGPDGTRLEAALDTAADLIAAEVVVHAAPRHLDDAVVEQVRGPVVIAFSPSPDGTWFRSGTEGSAGL